MRNDHFVSQFILRAFLSGNHLRVFNKKYSKISNKTPAQICYLPGFTTFDVDQVPPGFDNHFVEKELSKWETVIADIHKKLITERNIYSLCKEEFSELIRFAVWLSIANPVTQRMMSAAWLQINVKYIEALRDVELDKISLEIFGRLLPHDDLRQDLLRVARENGLLQSQFLDNALRGAERCHPIALEEYAWRLDDYKETGDCLCTSDRPVLISNSKLDQIVGFQTPNALLHFPLSSDLCLSGKNVGQGNTFIINHYMVNDPKVAKGLNSLMWAKSHKLIIASADIALPSSGLDLPSYLPEAVDYGESVALTMR